MILNGTDLRVYVNETLVAFARNNTLTISSEFIPISGQGSGFWKENLPSIIQWGVSVELLVDLTEGTGLPSMFELIAERTRFRLKVSTENESDEYYFLGMAYLSTLELGAPNEDVTTLNVEVIPDGMLERLPFEQLNISITEGNPANNGLIRLDSNGVLYVNGQNTNIWHVVKNGRVVESVTMSDDINVIALIGNYILVTIVGGNCYLYDSSITLINTFASTTDASVSWRGAVFYKGKLYMIKSNRYVIEFTDFVETDAFDLGSGDSLGNITVNKYGIFVTDDVDSSVEKVTFAGVVSTFLDVASTTYANVASDEDYLFIAYVGGGTLYVACYLDSTLKWTYPVGTYSDCSMTVDKDRNLYICVSDSIIKLKNKIVEATYEIIDTWVPEKTSPKDIQVSPTGTIILASGASVSGITFQ